MSADDWAFVLVGLAAIPATLYWLLYTFTAPFWRSAVGRALWTKAFGLMLLVDISLAYMLWGDDYPGRDAVRLTVYAIIVCGLWFQLGALIDARIKARRHE